MFFLLIIVTNFFFSDTTLVNYGEGVQSSNIESEVIETYSDSSQNVETVHRADELGNIYTDNSDTFISSQPDTLTDQYESYINDYTFDQSTLEQTQAETSVKYDKLDLDESADNTIVPNINDFQQSESANTYESQMTEEMLINEREREKKSKKELEEEEREKMQ